MDNNFEEKSKDDPVVFEKEDNNLELKEVANESNSAEIEKVEEDIADIESLVGKTFAEKYEVLSFLGKGGMSTVYKVRHKELDVIMALKVLHKHLWTDPLSVERFRMEAKTIGRLSSSYLVTFRDFGVTSYGQPYLVMDYLDGVSLGRKIEKESKIGVGQCLDVFEKLCKGLDEAHKHGITHRDIKPDNVVFLSDTDDANVKLVDFGIAKIAQEESDQRMTLTQTGEVFGSPLYMSPEQCLGVTVDHRSDIYSLGCLFYESLVGKPPLVEPTILETMNAHLLKKPLELVEQNSEIADEAKSLGIDYKDLDYVVMKCLQKEADDRYQSASQLIVDIEKIRNKQTISGKQKLWKQTSPVKRAFGIFSLVVASLITIVIAAYFVNPQVKSIADDVGMQGSWHFHQSMGRAANTLRDFEAAESHFRQSLDIANQLDSPGDKHLKRLASLDSLSNSLQFQAKYAQKDRVLEEYKAELRKSLGDLSNVDEDSHLDLIGSIDLSNEVSSLKSADLLYKLGKQSAREGKTDAAEKYFDKCYEIRKKWLSEGDEKLIESMDSLASISVLQEKHRKAGGLWERAFRQAQEHLPDTSKVKVSLYKNMGRICQSPRKRDYRKAELCYKKAVELSKKLYGTSSTQTINAMKDYAAFLNVVERKDEAERVWKSIEKLNVK